MLRDQRDPLVHRVLLDQQLTQVLLDPQVGGEPMEQLDLPDYGEFLEQQSIQAPQGFKVRKDHEALRALKELREPKARREPREPRALREPKVHKELRVLREPLEQQLTRVLLDRPE